MQLTSKQRSQLKSLAMTMKPNVIIGKDELTPNVLKEISTALYHNELVKVSLLQSVTTSTKELLDKVCNLLQCHPVQSVGSKFVVYKRSDKEGIEHIQLVK